MHNTLIDKLASQKLGKTKQNKTKMKVVNKVILIVCSEFIHMCSGL